MIFSEQKPGVLQNSSFTSVWWNMIRQCRWLVTFPHRWRKKRDLCVCAIIHLQNILRSRDMRSGHVTLVVEYLFQSYKDGISHRMSPVQDTSNLCDVRARKIGWVPRSAVIWRIFPFSSDSCLNWRGGDRWRHQSTLHTGRSKTLFLDQ